MKTLKINPYTVPSPTEPVTHWLLNAQVHLAGQGPVGQLLAAKRVNIGLTFTRCQETNTKWMTCVAKKLVFVGLIGIMLNFNHQINC